MTSNQLRLCFTACAAGAIVSLFASTGSTVQKSNPDDPVTVAVNKGIKWLVSTQGQDGGWGQDGGETSYVRNGERLESTGNDVANTAVAAEALLHSGSTPGSGPYSGPLRRAVNFILQRVERSPSGGLAVTDQNGTQIQRKLGPYIDTFLASKLLAEIDGSMGDTQANAKVRRSLEKCVAKIQQNQLADGSWNIAGGWAPILGTSMASRSLFIAQQKGVAVQPAAMAKIDSYTQLTASQRPVGAGGAAPIAASSAGVPLYKSAQELEQLSRTAADRNKNAPRIHAIQSQLSDARFATGYGSIGGEEFFSYLNVSDSLHRTGGPAWIKWNGDIKAKILAMQNEDGTWAGHHCITGRVAVTSAAILTLLAERDPAFLPTSNIRK